MGLYDSFETDKELEKTGVWIDYEVFRIRLGFAGGANKRFLSASEAKFKPLRRAIDAGTIDNDRATRILTDLYAENMIFGWETKVEEEWVSGIEGRDGTIIPFNVENVKLTLRNLPSLFMDLKGQGEAIVNFRKMQVKADSGNS